MANTRKPASRKPAASKEKASESRREKFLRLGKMRMEKTLKAISLLGNLAGPSYEYNDADVTKMNDALADAVEGVVKRFNPESKKKGVFAFDFNGESK